MTAPLPPCGCRTGCQHRDHPQFPAQRECRAGVAPTGPGPGPVEETPAQKVARVLGVELAPWQAQVLNAVLVLPEWPEVPDTDRSRVEAVFTPEQRARARWASWRSLRTVSGEFEL